MSQPDPMTMGALVTHLDITHKTLTEWMRRWPEFPVLRRGGRGYGYQFDPAAVTDFLVKQRELDQLKSAKRMEPIPRTQVDLGLKHMGGEREERGSTALSTAKVALLQKQVERQTRLEATARGELVPIGQVLDVLASALSLLGKANRASIAASARELNLPEAAARLIERNLSKDQREFTATLPDRLKDLTPGDD